MSKEDYENLKKEIRSILLTHQKGILLSRFQNDFRKMVGRPLPFRDFGFLNNAELLQSMPDVVRMALDGADFHLTGIADGSTAHIKNMVSKQKSGKPDNRRTPYRNRTFTTRLPSVPKAPIFTKPSQSNSPPFEASSHPSPSSDATYKNSSSLTNHMTKPEPVKTKILPPPGIRINEMPSHITKGIINLIRKYSTGLKLTDFLSSYERYYNIKFQCKDYGFSTLQDCLESIPDLKMTNGKNSLLIQVRDNIMPNKQANSLEQNSSKPPKGEEMASQSSRIKEEALLKKKMDYFFQKAAPYIHNQNEDHIQHSSGECFDLVNIQTDDEKNNLVDVDHTRQDFTEHSKKNILEMNGEKLNLMDDSPVSTSPEVPACRSSNIKCPVSESVKKNILKVLASNPNGIWATDFPVLYESICRRRFELHDLGFVDLAILVDSMPDVFVRKDVGSRKDWLIYPANKYEENEYGKDPSSTKSNVILIEMIILNTRKILQAYTEGLLVKDFISVYSINSSEPLLIRELGFDKLESFLLSIATRVPLMFKGSGDGQSIHLSEFQTTEESCEPIVSTDFLSVPYDVAPLDTIIEQGKVPKDLKPNQYSQVFVSSIESPGSLYIHFNGEEYDKMQALYDDIESFYNGPQSKLYQMNNAHIKEGMLCIAFWPEDRHWYRVIIRTVLSPEKVQVFYFDYGTVANISVTLLRYIKLGFTELPATAIKGRLAFLMPANNAVNWDPRAGARILELCHDVCLMGKYSEIDPDGTVAMVLCDTNDGKELFLNDLLVDEGLVDVSKGPKVVPTVPPLNQSLAFASNPLSTSLLSQDMSALTLLQTQNFLQTWNTLSATNPALLSQLIQTLSIGNQQAASSIQQPLGLSQTVPTPNASNIQANMASLLQSNMALLQNPMAFQNPMASLLNPMASTLQPSMSSVQNPTGSLQNPMASSLQNPMASSLQNPMASSLQNPMASSLQNPMASSLQNPMASSLQNPMASSLQNPIASSLQNPMASSLQNPMASRLQNPMASSLQNPMASSLQNPMASSLQNPMASSSLTNTSTNLPYGYASTPPCPIAKPVASRNAAESSRFLQATNGVEEGAYGDGGEVFGEDNDDMFYDFYKKASSVTKRYVKRIQTSDGYRFHILIVDSEAYVSGGDISGLIWSEKEPNYLLQRFQHRETVLTSRTVSEESNESMFQQFQKFNVKGCEKMGNFLHLLVYPLSSVIQILNMFGHPSEELRRSILNELAEFNMRLPVWQEISEMEFPNSKDDKPVVTDDDKINRMCLHDLTSLLAGIKNKKGKIESDYILSSTPSATRELQKLEEMITKVFNRITVVKNICDSFK